MSFREEWLSEGIDLRGFKGRSGRASDEVTRGRLVSLEGFPFGFCAKYEEWRDSQLVSQIIFASP